MSFVREHHVHRTQHHRRTSVDPRLTLPQLDLATSGKGGIGNFISICIIVAACRVADAHVQGGMVGDLSFMCPEFIQCCF
ncbi:hypothetical protein CsSME_00017466 [Camellia sinensis var. sinensis]